MSKTNKSKYAILGILNNKPSSGYDIKKYCDDTISHFWNENYGHIYPVLKKMEQEKLITRETQDTEGKPARNIYSITAPGKEMLADWLETPAEYQPIRNEFLLKLVFSKDVPIKKIIKNIENEKSKSQKILSELSDVEKNIKSDPRLKKSRSMQSWLVTIRYYILQISSSIKWCDESIKTFSDHEKH